MAQDWSADVKKYAPDADDKIISGIVRHCGIALHKIDSAMVAFSDPVETGRVREGFLKKKLALTLPDGELDAAIAKVGEMMKGDRTKNRVTVYYLLAQAFGQLELFRKAPTAAKTKTKVATNDTAPIGAAALGASAIGTAAAGSKTTGTDAAGANPLLPKKGAARPTALPVEDTAPMADSDPSADGLGAEAVGIGPFGGASIHSAPIIEPVPVADIPPPPPPARVTDVPAPPSPSQPLPPFADVPPSPPLVRVADVPPPLPPVAPPTPIEPVSRRDRYISTPDESVVETKAGGSMRWLPWLLLGLGVLALLWYFLIHRPH